MRTIAHHAADTRKTLRDRTESWMRAYIGRHAIRILTTDEELRNQGMEPALSPKLREALKTMRGLAMMADE